VRKEQQNKGSKSKPSSPSKISTKADGVELTEEEMKKVSGGYQSGGHGP